MSREVGILRLFRMACGAFALLFLFQEWAPARHPDPDPSVVSIVDTRLFDMKGYVQKRLAAATEKEKQEAARLAAEGENLHRRRNDPFRGLRSYERAALLYPDPVYYYEMGNCLASGKEYGGAIAAYRGAVERGYKEKRLVWYNAACAASLMGDTARALHFLETALSEGYDAIPFIRKDPDMSGLSGTGGFERLLDVYESRLGPIERCLVGVWQDSPVMASGWGDTYQFYHDGNFVFNTNQMDCGTRLLAEHGSWQIEGKRIRLVIKKETVIQGGKRVPATGSCGSEYEIEGGKTVTEKTKVREKTLRIEAFHFDEEFNKNRVIINGKKFWRFSLRAEDYR